MKSLCENNIIHRDLKLANILIHNDIIKVNYLIIERYVILDFLNK